MSVWKRNAVIVVIVLFVGAAVYLNWSYNNAETADETASAEESPKILGQASLVSGEEDTDALLADGDEDDGIESATGYFATARLNRQQARDSALELLQEAAQAEDADQAMIDEANASIQTMAAYTLSEAQVENLVVAKGYEDCVCFLSEDSASVVVAATEDGLGDADVARIAEIVKEETGLSVSQIKILETEP
jgi:stage III sporulation protein AH